MATNGVRDDQRKLRLFIEHVGPYICQLLPTLQVPREFDDWTFAGISVTLFRHFRPKHNEVAERCAFNRRDQLPDESARAYGAALRYMAQTCNFGAFLDAALRDRFVAGQRDERVRARLMQVPQLTVKGATRLAHSMETGGGGGDLQKEEAECVLEEPRQWVHTTQQQDGADASFVPETRTGHRGRLRLALQGWQGQSFSPYRDVICCVCNGTGHFGRFCSVTRQ